VAVRGWLPGLAALAVALASPAHAETLSFKANLMAVAGTNSTASGSLVAEYDSGSKKLTWRGTYSGIGTYATAAAIYGPGNKVIIRLRKYDSPFEGTAILADPQAAELKAGKWFVLVRTSAFPNGELRGQIEPGG
jgi:hypothetical protein